MKIFIFLVLILSFNSFAGRTLHSEIIPTESMGKMNMDVCKLTDKGDGEGVFETYNCFLGDAASFNGYSINFTNTVHGTIPSISHFGEKLSYEQLYQDLQPNSESSHFFAPTNGVIDVRYLIDDEIYEGIDSYALIIRMSTDRLSFNQEEGYVSFTGETDEELLVFQLNGKKTKLIGKIDARKEKNANFKAQQLADSLIK